MINEKAKVVKGDAMDEENDRKLKDPGFDLGLGFSCVQFQALRQSDLRAREI